MEMRHGDALPSGQKEKPEEDGSQGQREGGRWRQVVGHTGELALSPDRAESDAGWLSDFPAEGLSSAPDVVRAA